LTVTALLLLGFLTLTGIGLMGLALLREGERRAASVALGLALLGSMLFFLAILLPVQLQRMSLGALAVSVAAGVLLFLLPIGRVELGNDVPQVRVDERDIMFARARLEPGTIGYEAYYAMRPENKAGDDKTRSLPGLLSLEASEANPLVFASTDAAFALIDELQRAVEGPASIERVKTEAGAMSAYIKGMTCYLGAHSVGICRVKPYQVYTHIGRGSGEVGAPVSLDHRYAIAFAVEMDRTMTATAPAAPTLLESARQYGWAAQIAVQLAIFIRSLGYPARAHIDGNYRVIAPLVARDAGLGEFGRMGLLMTPGLGPRVRLGVVTTDLPLVPDRRNGDTSVIDFCQVCHKCAESCPVRAIPFGGRQEIDGALRWRINHDVCYRYWNVTGTDCARCMAVCPYSYPNSPIHNSVRRAVRRSGFARRAVICLDRVFYGPTPPPKPAPDWVPRKPGRP
jgi:reductive dehalogenase